MAAIPASLVKALRDKTGAGMMDCKRALGETDGDLEAAVDWLRKKGLSDASKKAARVAAEGLVAVAAEGNRGAVIEVNSETDFVARNPDFQGFAQTVAGTALAEGGDLDKIKAAAYPAAGHSVAEELTSLVGRIGENLVLRRSAAVTVPQGLVASYVHNASVANAGQIGVIVGLETEATGDAVATLGRQLAMHICATNPESVTREGVSAESLDREREVLADQARASGKPEEIIEKMVEGRLRKFYEQVVLLDQVFVVDGESKVADVVKKVAGEAGAPIRVSGFQRFELGAGIEKQQADFAAEVAAQVGQ